MVVRMLVIMVVVVRAGVVWMPVAVVAVVVGAWGGRARDGGQPGVG